MIAINNGSTQQFRKTFIISKKKRSSSSRGHLIGLFFGVNFLILSTFLFLLIHPASPVQAQLATITTKQFAQIKDSNNSQEKPTTNKNSSASASESDETDLQLEDEEEASPSASTTSEIKKRLEKILGEQDENNSENKLSGFIAEVVRVTAEAITVKTPNGNQIIPIDESIKILKRNRPFSVENVEVGNWILGIGERVKNGDISPKIILVQTTSLAPKEHTIALGTIVEKTNSSVTFLPRGQEEPTSFQITRGSKISDSTDEPITIKELPTDVSAILVASSDNNKWTVKSIRILIDMDEFKTSATPTPIPRPVVKSPTPSASPIVE